jgi:dihydrodipicolinate synthase/N-acetylneuraminate lyase
VDTVRIVCPLPTPLRDEEEIDVRALKRLVEHLVPEVDAFFLLGSSGENATLRDRVRLALVEEATAAIAGRRPVWIGIGEAGTERAIDSARRVAPFAPDALVACGPYYFGAASQADLLAHHRRIADSVTAPVFLYDIPQLTGLALEPATVATLAEHPNVIGIKDSSGDFVRFQASLAAAGPGFLAYIGREDLLAAAMWLGGTGVVSALAAVGPRLLRSLITAALAGDREEAGRIQREVSRAARVFFVAHPVASLKMALAAQGLMSPLTVAPMGGVDRRNMARVRELLAESGLLSNDGAGGSSGGGGLAEGGSGAAERGGVAQDGGVAAAGRPS